MLVRKVDFVVENSIVDMFFDINQYKRFILSFSTSYRKNLFGCGEKCSNESHVFVVDRKLVFHRNRRMSSILLHIKN